jgi:hypothetical protein
VFDISFVLSVIRGLQFWIATIFDESGEKSIGDVFLRQSYLLRLNMVVIRDKSSPSIDKDVIKAPIFLPLIPCADYNSAPIL